MARRPMINSVSRNWTKSTVITSCAVAIAETGTLILDGSPGQGRRIITLIPDYHLCVVFADQIVADVPEALPDWKLLGH